MDIKEFIELYVNSSDEIQAEIEQTLEAIRQQIALQE